MTKRYGDEIKFLQTFDINLQAAFCVYPERCILGSAPTLYQVSETYGTGTAKTWLVPQLNDLSEFCGCKDKLTLFQQEQLARIIYNEYHWLKVTELMLFFYWFKSGRYGRFYGSVDPLVITTSLRDFLRDRAAIYDRHVQEERQRKDEESRKGAITWEEYCMKTYGKIKATPLTVRQHEE